MSREMYDARRQFAEQRFAIGGERYDYELSGAAVMKVTVDQNGNQLSVTNATGHKWSTTYDNKDRPQTATDPIGRVSRVKFNLADEVVEAVTASGRKVKYEYDGRGQQKKITDPMNGAVKFTYDNRGNLTSITDQRGNATTFTYDELFRPIATTDPTGRSSSVSYDAMNNVVEAIDRLGRRTTFIYDVLDRADTISYEDATVTMSYDAAGRVTQINDTESGSIVWSYDNANRLLTETTAAGAVSYTYKNANQRVMMTALDRQMASSDNYISRRTRVQ